MKPSKIKYQITNGYGLWQHYKSEGLVLEVLTEDVEEGYIQINEVQSEIEHGLTTLDLSILEDGIYEPILVSNERVFRLEAIEKTGYTVRPVKTSDATLRRLLKRVKELECTTADLEERMLAAEEKIRTDVLF